MIITIALAGIFPAGAWADGGQALNHGQIASDLAALADLARIAAGTIGFLLLGGGLLAFIKSKGRQESPGRALSMVLVGGVLLSVASAVDMAAGSLFGGDSLQLVGIESHVTDKAGPAADMFATALRISWVVGFLGFVAGWYGLTKERPQVGVCIAKILGGSCAMNLPIMVQAAAKWGGVFASIGTYIN
jgi:ABC-type Co2+ transport system permease subunit